MHSCIKLDVVKHLKNAMFLPTNSSDSSDSFLSRDGKLTRFAAAQSLQSPADCFARYFRIFAGNIGFARNFLRSTQHQTLSLARGAISKIRIEGFRGNSPERGNLFRVCFRWVTSWSTVSLDTCEKLFVNGKNFLNLHK